MTRKISNPPPLWLCSHVLYIRHIIFLLHVKIRYCKKLHLRFDNYIVFTLSGGSEWGSRKHSINFTTITLVSPVSFHPRNEASVTQKKWSL